MLKKQEMLEAIGFVDLTESDRMTFAGAPEESMIYHGSYYTMIWGVGDDEQELIVVETEALVDVAGFVVAVWTKESLQELMKKLDCDKRYEAYVKRYNRLWDKGRDYVDRNSDKDRQICSTLQEITKHYTGE